MRYRIDMDRCNKNRELNHAVMIIWEGKQYQKPKPTKGDVKMSSRLFRNAFALFLLVFALSYSICPGADYAVDKGSNMFGITAGFVSASGGLYEEDGESFTAILLMPHTVYFFVPNLGFGGDLLLLHTRQGNTGISTLGLGPKGMFFFGGRYSKAYPYLTSGFYYVRNTIDYGKHDHTVSGTRLKLGGGASIMIADHLGLLMEASYNLDNFEAEDNGKSESGNGVILSVGLAGFIF